MAENKPIIDININNIFYQLHDTALKQSASANDDGKLVIVNSGVDEKNTIYTGSGEFTIISQPDASDESKYLGYLLAYQQNVDDFRSKCFAHIKKYVEFFIGENVAASLKPDMLNPLYPIAQKKNKSNESIKIDYSKPLLENLFEADDSDEPGGVDSDEPGGVDSDESSEGHDGSEHSEDTPVNTDAEKKPVGFELQYDSNVVGIKRNDYDGAITDCLKKASETTKKTIGPAMKSVFGPLASAIGNSLFGGLIDDLASFHVDTMAGDIKAGKIAVDVAKGALQGGKALAGMAKDAANIHPTIDKDKVDNDVLTQIRKVASNADINNIVIYTPDEMRNKLVSQKKLTSEIKRELEEVSYVMEIVVPHGSKDYPNINSEWIAKNVCTAVNKNYKLNRYTPKDFKVICIKDFKPTYKLRSEYDQDLGKKLRQEITKNRRLNASMSFSTYDSLMCLLFEDTGDGERSLANMRDDLIKKLKKHRNALPVVVDQLDNIMPNDVIMALASFSITKDNFISDLKTGIEQSVDDETGEIGEYEFTNNISPIFNKFTDESKKNDAKIVFKLFDTIITIISTVNNMKPEYKRGRPSKRYDGTSTDSDTYLVFNKYIKEKSKKEDSDYYRN